MNTLENLSNELIDITNRASQWVVRVNGRRGPSASGILWTADTVLTSQKAVHRENNVEVGLPDGTMVNATVSGRSPALDLCMLSLDEPVDGYEELPWSSDPRAGLALALARDRQGVLLAKLGLLPGEELIHRFAPAPEFLGSPLIDHKGNYLGIHVVVGRPMVLSFTKLTNLAKSMAEGEVLESGFLGLGLHPVEHENGQGCLVINAEPPAVSAGIKVGDILTSINGEPAKEPMGVKELLCSLAAGAIIKVEYLRAGSPQETEVVLAPRKHEPHRRGFGHHIKKVIRHIKHHHHHHGPPPHHGPPSSPVIC